MSTELLVGLQQCPSCPLWAPPASPGSWRQILGPFGALQITASGCLRSSRRPFPCGVGVVGAPAPLGSSLQGGRGPGERSDRPPPCHLDSLTLQAC